MALQKLLNEQSPTICPRSLVFLTTSLKIGGAQTQFVRLAIALKARNWDVKLISMIPPEPCFPELAECGIPVASLGMRRGRVSARVLFTLATMLRQDRPEILHCHMVHANLLGRMVRLLTSIPVVVCSAHSVNEGGWCRDWWYRLTDRLCDLTVHVSSVGLRRYTQRRMVNPKTAMFVPNAVDTTVFRSDPDSRQQVRRALALDPHFVWLAVGSLDKAKDYPNLIQAFAHVCRDDADSLLLIAGDGVLRAQVQAMIEELGIGNRVKLLGTRTDIPHLMNAADAYVMSSAWEGMPCVLLEASACELPAVATDVGDAGEIIREGTTGFLVPPGQPERLAEAMIRMAALPRARRREMGQAAREHVEGAYSLRHVVDTWESLFSSLLAKKCQR